MVSRDPANRAARDLTEGDNDGEPVRSKRSCAADDTLLTFCPPGPEARMKLIVSSDGSIEMEGVMGMRAMLESSSYPMLPNEAAAVIPLRLSVTSPLRLLELRRAA